METTELMTIKVRRLSYEQLTKLPIKFHKDFSERWRKKYGPDFHNEKHIQVLIRVSERYLGRCKNGKDPLNVLKSITLWNEKYFEYLLDLEKFRKATKLAFAWHDMGNIASDVNFDDNIPQYLEVYTSGKLEIDGQTKIAEERSKDMFLKSLGQSNIEKGERKLYEKLVPELIMLTKYRQDVPKDEDFALFVSAIDQIGNSVLSDDLDRFRGLIIEQAIEFGSKNKDYKVNPCDIVNFTDSRIKIMLGDESDTFLQIIDAQMPELSDINVRYDRLMEWRKAVEVLEEYGV